jgi:hypothetical protein
MGCGQEYQGRVVRLVAGDERLIFFKASKEIVASIHPPVQWKYGGLCQRIKAIGALS